MVKDESQAAARTKVGNVDLRGYVASLEDAGLLKRITVEVNLKHELGAISALNMDRNGPALLFENIKGYPGHSLVTNLMDSPEKLALGFGTAPDGRAIIRKIRESKEKLIPPVVVETGLCQEEVHTGHDVDLYEFPTPWWHEGDGGQYIGTTAAVITADADTGHTNYGLYRAMIKDKQNLTLNARGRPFGETPRGYGTAMHIFQNEVNGRPTPIALALGMDPRLTYSGAQSVPSQEYPHAEYALAGALGGEAVPLVRCVTNPSLLVPAYAEIIIEGEVMPGVRTTEGPHGESPGFYSHSDLAFLMKVTCITHRKKPLSYGLICRQHEDYPKWLFTDAFRESNSHIEQITDMYIPDHVGASHALMAVIGVRVNSPEEVDYVIQNLRGAPEAYGSRMPRWTILVDEDCDIRDWDDVLWRVMQGVMPDVHMRIGPRDRPSPHDPLTDLYGGKTSSVVIDATFRAKRGPGGEIVRFKPVNKVTNDLKAQVLSRWKEFGLE